MDVQALVRKQLGQVYTNLLGKDAADAMLAAPAAAAAPPSQPGSKAQTSSSSAGTRTSSSARPTAAAGKAGRRHKSQARGRPAPPAPSELDTQSAGSHAAPRMRSLHKKSRHPDAQPPSPEQPRPEQQPRRAEAGQQPSSQAEGKPQPAPAPAPAPLFPQREPSSASSISASTTASTRRRRRSRGSRPLDSDDSSSSDDDDDKSAVARPTSILTLAGSKKAPSAPLPAPAPPAAATPSPSAVSASPVPALPTSKRAASPTPSQVSTTSTVARHDIFDFLASLEAKYGGQFDEHTAADLASAKAKLAARSRPRNKAVPAAESALQADTPSTDMAGKPAAEPALPKPDPWAEREAAYQAALRALAAEHLPSKERVARELDLERQYLSDLAELRQERQRGRMREVDAIPREPHNTVPAASLRGPLSTSLPRPPSEAGPLPISQARPSAPPANASYAERQQWALDEERRLLREAQLAAGRGPLGSQLLDTSLLRSGVRRAAPMEHSQHWRHNPESLQHSTLRLPTHHHHQHQHRHRQHHLPYVSHDYLNTTTVSLSRPPDLTHLHAAPVQQQRFRRAAPPQHRRRPTRSHLRVRFAAPHTAPLSPADLARPMRPRSPVRSRHYFEGNHLHHTAGTGRLSGSILKRREPNAPPPPYSRYSPSRADLTAATVDVPSALASYADLHSPPPESVYSSVASMGAFLSTVQPNDITLRLREMLAAMDAEAEQHHSSNGTRRMDWQDEDNGAHSDADLVGAGVETAAQQRMRAQREEAEAAEALRAETQRLLAERRAAKRRTAQRQEAETQAQTTATETARDGKRVEEDVAAAALRAETQHKLQERRAAKQRAVEAEKRAEADRRAAEETQKSKELAEAQLKQQEQERAAAALRAETQRKLEERRAAKQRATEEEAAHRAAEEARAAEALAASQREEELAAAALRAETQRKLEERRTTKLAARKDDEQRLQAQRIAAETRRQQQAATAEQEGRRLAKEEADAAAALRAETQRLLEERRAAKQRVAEAERQAEEQRRVEEEAQKRQDNAAAAALRDETQRKLEERRAAKHRIAEREVQAQQQAAQREKEEQERSRQEEEERQAHERLEQQRRQAEQELAALRADARQRPEARGSHPVPAHSAWSASLDTAPTQDAAAAAAQPAPAPKAMDRISVFLRDVLGHDDAEHLGASAGAAPSSSGGLENCLRVCINCGEDNSIFSAACGTCGEPFDGVIPRAPSETSKHEEEEEEEEDSDGDGELPKPRAPRPAVPPLSPRARDLNLSPEPGLYPSPSPGPAHAPRVAWMISPSPELAVDHDHEQDDEEQDRDLQEEEKTKSVLRRRVEVEMAENAQQQQSGPGQVRPTKRSTAVQKRPPRSTPAAAPGKTGPQTAAATSAPSTTASTASRLFAPLQLSSNTRPRTSRGRPASAAGSSAAPAVRTALVARAARPASAAPISAATGAAASSTASRPRISTRPSSAATGNRHHRNARRTGVEGLELRNSANRPPTVPAAAPTAPAVKWASSVRPPRARPASSNPRMSKSRQAQRSTPSLTASVAPAAAPASPPGVASTASLSKWLQSPPRQYLNIEDLGRSPPGLQAPTSWDLLPYELWVLIFSWLERRDLKSSRLVCRRLSEIGNDPILWRSMQIKNALVDTRMLSTLGRRHPAILTLRSCNGLCGANIPAFLATGAAFLRKLVLVGSTLDSTALRALGQACTGLRHLDLSWSGVGDAGVRALAGGSRAPLQSLVLKGCQQVSDKGLAALAEQFHQTLRSLDLFGCSLVSSTGVSQLAAHCHQLETLVLSQCNSVSDKAIGRLAAAMPNLRELNLRGCKQVRRTCLRALAQHCPRLERLNLGYCLLVDNEAVEALCVAGPSRPQLRLLDLCSCINVTDAGVRRVLQTHGQTLEVLDLGGTEINPETLQLLATSCPDLQTLKLNSCPNVTVAALKDILGGCPAMRELSVVNCTRITGRDTYQLCKDYPLVKVHAK